MSPADTKRLLIIFAVLEFVLGAVMIVVFDNLAIGANQIAIGASLVAVAAATGKKKSNG